MPATPPHIAIALFSGSGTIARSAEMIATAARQDGCTVTLIDVATLTDDDWATLNDADAILFGTPTYLGGPAAAFKGIMDATGDAIWVDRLWQDKLTGGFTPGVNTAGDKFAALQSLNTFAMQHGMVWVGQAVIGAPVVPDNQGLNISGTFLGLAVNSTRNGQLTQGCQESAKIYGKRLSTAIKRWKVGFSWPPKAFMTG